MSRGVVLVAGASGFVGRAVVPRLVEAGWTVRSGSRRPEAQARHWPEDDWVALDVDDPDSVAEALRGADAMMYLVHHMSADADLMDAERHAARTVREACEAEGIRRLVYLGGPEPEGAPSHHLQARLMTGEILRAGTVSTIELRASMIVGVGSLSWLMVRDLAMRLPAMVLPSWLETRTEPIGIDDVVAALTHAVGVPHVGSAWYDLPGPEVMSARQILERVAALRGMRPLMVPVPFLTPHLSSHWIRFVSRADYEVARHLVHGLTSDILADGEGYWALAPEVERTPFDEAARRALEAEDTVPPVGRAWEWLAKALAPRA